MINIFPINFFASELFDKNKIDKAIESFDNKSQIGIVIIETSRADMEYIHNPDFINKAKLSPGSIAKIWSSAVIIDDATSTFNKENGFTCSGSFRVPENIHLGRAGERYNFRNDTQGAFLTCSLRNGHGRVMLLDALSVSCNNYFLTKSSLNPGLFYRELADKWLFEEQVGEDWMKLLSAIGEGPLMTVAPADVAVRLSAFWGDTPVMTLHGKDEPYQIVGNLNISGKARNMIKAALRRCLAEGTLKELKINVGGISILGGKTGTGTLPGALYSVSGWNAIFFSLENSHYLLLTVCRKGTGSGKALKLSQLVLNNIR